MYFSLRAIQNNARGEEVGWMDHQPPPLDEIGGRLIPSCSPSCPDTEFVAIARPTNTVQKPEDETNTVRSETANSTQTAEENRIE